jgi:hypothetical protein
MQVPYWAENLGDSVTFARVATAAAAAVVNQSISLFTHSVAALIVPPYLVLLLFMLANFVIGASRALMYGDWDLLKSTKTPQKFAVYTLTGVLIASVGYLSAGVFNFNPTAGVLTVFYIYAILAEADSIADNIGGYPVARTAIRMVAAFLKTKLKEFAGLEQKDDREG